MMRPFRRAAIPALGRLLQGRPPPTSGCAGPRPCRARWNRALIRRRGPQRRTARLLHPAAHSRMRRPPIERRDFRSSILARCAARIVVSGERTTPLLPEVPSLTVGTGGNGDFHRYPLTAPRSDRLKMVAARSIMVVAAPPARRRSARAIRSAPRAARKHSRRRRPWHHS